jgi:hypothetical protein
VPPWRSSSSSSTASLPSVLDPVALPWRPCKAGNHAFGMRVDFMSIEIGATLRRSALSAVDLASRDYG